MTHSSISHTLFLVVFVVASLVGGVAPAVTILPDDSRLGLRGAAYPQISSSQLELLRFSPDLLAAAAPPTHNFSPDKARSTGGSSLVFVTDSPQVTVQFSLDKNTNFGIYQDGLFQQIQRAKLVDGLLEIESTSPGEAVEYRIVMPSFENPILTGLELETGAQLHDPPAPPEMVFAAIGDSITHGRGQDAGHQTWGWQVAQALDMDFYNLAVGGSNANAHMPSVVADMTRVDLVSILWGYNDWVNRGKTIEEYTSDMNAAIDEVRASHPETTIAVLRMLQTTTTESKRTGTTYTADDFRDAASDLVQVRRDAGDLNVHIIASDMMTNTSSDLNDQVHLSIDGAANLAMALIPELSAIGVPEPNSATLLLVGSLAALWRRVQKGRHDVSSSFTV